MKYTYISFLAIVLIIGAVVYTRYAEPVSEQGDEYVVADEDMLKDSLIAEVESAELSESERQGLLLMREEEKLARDVYMALYEQWGLQIFKNIAASEQTHTDAVKDLLDRYDIEDPVAQDREGTFENAELQTLYDDLVAKGEVDLNQALIVGATIEDLDIYDINSLLDNVDNEDIQIVYNNLIRGSENHLRAFYRQIEMRGGEYAPQFISQDQFEAILNN